MLAAQSAPLTYAEELFSITDFSVTRVSLEPGEIGYVNTKIKNSATTNLTLTHFIELPPDLGTAVSVSGAGIVTLIPNEERSFTLQVKNNGALTVDKDAVLIYKVQDSIGTTKTQQFAITFKSGNAQPSSYVPTYDVYCDLNAFAPAKIILDYVYTANFSGPLNMQTASALSTSIWSINLSPVNMEFRATDNDIYEFDVVIAYNGTVGQSLTVSVWSGDLSPNIFRYWIQKSQITLHFRISVATQPKYPTTEEVAEQVIVLVKQELLYYFDKMSLLTASFEANLWTIWIIVIVALISSILSLAVGFMVLKQRR